MSETITAPPRQLRVDAQRNYDAIVRVASEAFSENGTQTSLDDIACRAGVGPGTLYRHFPTRDCLLVAALNDSVAELARSAERLQDADDAGAGLDEWLFLLASHLRTYGGLPESVAVALREQDSPLCQSCDSMRGWTAGLLTRAQKADAARPELTADDVFTVVASLAWAADKRRDSEEDLRRLIGLFVVGLR